MGIESYWFLSSLKSLCLPESLPTYVPITSRNGEVFDTTRINQEVGPKMKFQISPYGTHQFKVCKEEHSPTYGGEYWAPVYYKPNRVEEMTTDSYYERRAFSDWVGAIFNTEREAERMIDTWIAHKAAEKRAEEVKAEAEARHIANNPPRIYP